MVVRWQHGARAEADPGHGHAVANSCWESGRVGVDHTAGAVGVECMRKVVEGPILVVWQYLELVELRRAGLQRFDNIRVQNLVSGDGTRYE